MAGYFISKCTYLEITLVFPLATSFTFVSTPRSQRHCITIGQDGCSFLVIKKKK